MEQIFFLDLYSKYLSVSVRQHAVVDVVSKIECSGRVSEWQILLQEHSIDESILSLLAKNRPANERQHVQDDWRFFSTRNKTYSLPNQWMIDLSLLFSRLVLVALLTKYQFCFVRLYVWGYWSRIKREWYQSKEIFAKYHSMSAHSFRSSFGCPCVDFRMRLNMYWLMVKIGKWSDGLFCFLPPCINTRMRSKGKWTS